MVPVFVFGVPNFFVVCLVFLKVVIQYSRQLESSEFSLHPCV